MLESNHDVMMLENGPYPYSLKKRILGKKDTFPTTRVQAPPKGS